MQKNRTSKRRTGQVLSPIESTCMPTPLGRLRVTAGPRGITGVTLARTGPVTDPGQLSPDLRRFRKELAEYFAGKRTAFTVRLDLQGTAFQQRVWQALQRLPSGSTLTYGELASSVGRPAAVRAVASAVARNPAAIIIPCHRIVPKNGPQPGNYAWGKHRKVWLLRHEGLEL